jgi:hypothetical protein
MANCYCTTSSVDLCDHCTETFSQGWDSGKTQEHERIIALLEDYRKSITVQSASTAGGSWALQNALALIKGENK